MDEVAVAFGVGGDGEGVCDTEGAEHGVEDMAAKVADGAAAVVAESTPFEGMVYFFFVWNDGSGAEPEVPVDV